MSWISRVSNSIPRPADGRQDESDGSPCAVVPWNRSKMQIQAKRMN